MKEIYFEVVGRIKADDMEDADRILTEIIEAVQIIDGARVTYNRLDSPEEGN